MSGIEELELGDHAALFYQSTDEQLQAVIPFMAIGLERNEQCLYIAVDHTPEAICRKLEEFGVDVPKALKSGALNVLTKHETYLRHGVFQPDRMIEELRDAVQAAMDSGFTGLRAAGELSWALDLPSALAQLVTYEEELDEHFYSKFAALCQYDASRFPAYIADHMKRLHPVIVCDGEVIRKPSRRKLANNHVR